MRCLPLRSIPCLALLLCACAGGGRDELATTSGPDSGGETATGDTGGGAGTTGADSGATAGTEGGGSSSGGDSDGSTGPGTGGASSGGGSSGGSTTGGNPNGKPNGEACSSDQECMSGNCYLVPMAGFCAECNEDADCPDGGCQADPVAGEAFCTDGSLGTMCQTDAACGPGLVCTELFDGKGFVDASYCSHCASDADCNAGEICAPHYNDGDVSGYRTCVAPGSVPNDQGCPVDGNGVGNGAACASGICSVADAYGLGIYVGVCGECLTSADCGGGTCIDAVANLMGVKGAYCQ